MTRPKSVVAIAGLAFVLLTAYSFSAVDIGKPDPSDVKEDDIRGDWKDKVVLIQVAESNALESKSHSAVLQNAKVRKLGNCDFLLGDSYVLEGDESGEWYKDTAMGIPCDHIVRFQIMSESRYKDYIKLWKDRSNNEDE
jgi:hypothetical protein